MVKILIAYDHADPALGPYFSSCYQEMQCHAEQCNTVFQVLELDSSNDDQVLQNAITDLEGRPFIFTAFTHGENDTILLANSPLVHPKNAYYFGDSMVYTCACNAGKALANHLTHHNCRAFIGFSYENKLPQMDSYDSYFQECEMFGLKIFMEGSSSIQESYDAMIKYYTDKFDELVEVNSPAAWMLLINRDALVLEASDSNRQLTLVDFHS